MNKINELIICPPLNTEHIASVKKDLDTLIKTNPGASSKSLPPSLMFPGAGDIAEKEDPAGDYIIFHELMEYAVANGKDIIFLTHDITKGDWMHTDGGPLIHYIDNFYRNTNRLLYVLDAERTLNDIYEISFEPVIDDQSPTNDDVKSEVGYDPTHLRGIFTMLIKMLQGYEPLKRHVVTGNFMALDFHIPQYSYISNLYFSQQARMMYGRTLIDIIKKAHSPEQAYALIGEEVNHTSK